MDQVKAIDVASSGELARLVATVREAGQPVLLMENGQVIAVLQPVPVADPMAIAHQSPQDFYAEATARPDIAEILRRLAK